ncbi:MAG: heparinase II/III family protein [Bacteroidota bacterium]
MKKQTIFPRKHWIILVLAIILFPNLHAQIRPNEWNGLMAPLPDPLTSLDGTVIEDRVQWEAGRRDEVLELFRDYMYGKVPAMEMEISHRVIFMDRKALDGKAVMKQVEVRLMGLDDTIVFPILIFLPGDHSGPVPLFLGLNFNGNHTIHPDPRISITKNWVRNNEELHVENHQAMEESRGTNASRWPVELILSRGYGVATMYSGDIDPDFDDGFQNGVHALDQGERTPSSWGTIAAWAWGLSRAMDYLEQDPDVDADRIAVLGHSRLGKAALWAGAQDERFALVVSNNSGCGGAALSRRPFGERVSAINDVFPHWFAGAFKSYNDNETACPVDQHMLLSLVAPRPLYVASAGEDDWADQYGEYLSLYYGSRVYGLYGEDKLENRELPPLDQPRRSGSLGYHIRTGKHDITQYDWEQYMDFADVHMTKTSAGTYENPVTMEWLATHLQGGSPRLILTPELETMIRKTSEAGDPKTQWGLRLMRESAGGLLEKEPLVYKQTGRRLLGVSREAVRRLTTLALVYRMERDEKYLDRLEAELTSVCSFEHWNPSHFLDVAEMAAGVALALDWAGEWISPEVDALARKALVENALIPGIASSENNFFTGVTHNWNMVCNGGLSLAALVMFEQEPELSSAVLHQAVETLPLSLKPYAPGGIYPEGASYWFYATTYLTATLSAFESSMGTDFGFSTAPGLMESAQFSQVLAGPSGMYYNYFDSGEGGLYSLEHFGLLAWFANRSGSGVNLDLYGDLLKKELENPRQARGTRFFPFFFLELAQVEKEHISAYTLPSVWIAGGDEPLGILRDSGGDPGGFFLAAKGGMAEDNHGNMDAGSFVLELDGVRWSVDPGNQSYDELEQIMGLGLWETNQESPRWSLLTKNNLGHSTLTVNDHMHLVDARAGLDRLDIRSRHPEFTFDMTGLYGKDLVRARRTFIRTGEKQLVIRDELLPSPLTKSITWQMITTAEASARKDGVMLKQDGKTLYIRMQGDTPHEVNIVKLSPPPLAYDKDIPGLKRIEFRIRGEAIQDLTGFAVELTSASGSVQ